jgi:hypothetical protein
MPTLIEYADQVAGGDTGVWRAAVDRAVALTPRWTVGQGTYPDQEVPFRGLALLVYALANHHQVDPAEIDTTVLATWLAEHREVNTSDMDPAELGRWLAEQHEPRRMTALAAMLTAAGHILPPRTLWVEVRPTGDPVADIWAQMTCLDSGDPDPRDFLGSTGPWPDPVLPAALHGVEWLVSSPR